MFIGFQFHRLPDRWRLLLAGLLGGCQRLRVFRNACLVQLLDGRNEGRFGFGGLVGFGWRFGGCFWFEIEGRGIGGRFGLWLLLDLWFGFWFGRVVGLRFRRALL